MPRTGLRQRANCGRPRVLTRRRAALSVRGESKPGADHGLQPQDAGVPRWIWIVGLRNGTIRYAAPLVRRFERQSVHGGSDAAEVREQTGPEVHLHGFCTDAAGDQEQVDMVTKVAALGRHPTRPRSRPELMRRERGLRFSSALNVFGRLRDGRVTHLASPPGPDFPSLETD